MNSYHNAHPSFWPHLIMISLFITLTIAIKLKQASRMGTLAIRHQILCWLYMVLWPIIKIQSFWNRKRPSP